VTPPAQGTATERDLQRIRAGYGAALVFLPGTTIFLATGRLPSRRTRRVAQLLGVRHLAQAALTAAKPRPEVLAAGALIDAVHATSMLLLAAVSRAGRSAALTDALAEAAFAAAGCSASIQALPSVAAGIGFPERQAEARRVRVRRHDPAGRVQGAVEEHPLDPLVVVKVLDVPQVRYRGAHPRVQVGRAVPGNL
jgi:hypothetical protein